MIDTNVCLLDYNYFKLIAIDLSKQQALDVDPKAIQQINFKFFYVVKRNDLNNSNHFV